MPEEYIPHIPGFPAFPGFQQSGKRMVPRTGSQHNMLCKIDGHCPRDGHHIVPPTVKRSYQDQRPRLNIGQCLFNVHFFHNRIRTVTEVKIKILSESTRTRKVFLRLLQIFHGYRTENIKNGDGLVRRKHTTDLMQGEKGYLTECSVKDKAVSISP